MVLSTETLRSPEKPGPVAEIEPATDNRREIALLTLTHGVSDVVSNAFSAGVVGKACCGKYNTSSQATAGLTTAE